MGILRPKPVHMEKTPVECVRPHASSPRASGSLEKRVRHSGSLQDASRRRPEDVTAEQLLHTAVGVGDDALACCLVCARPAQRDEQVHEDRALGRVAREQRAVAMRVRVPQGRQRVEPEPRGPARDAAAEAREQRAPPAEALLVRLDALGLGGQLGELERDGCRGGGGDGHPLLLGLGQHIARPAVLSG